MNEVNVMKDVEKMLLKLAAAGVCAKLEVEISDSLEESKRWSAALVNDAGEVIDPGSAETNGSFRLAMLGDSVEDAIARLDEVCSLTIWLDLN